MQEAVMTNSNTPIDPRQALDMQAQAMLAQASGSLSPQSVAVAWLDWASHLATSPGKLAELTQLPIEHAVALSRYAQESLAAAGQQLVNAPSIPPAVPLPDRRFSDPLWQQFPYNVLQQSFLMNQRWWDTA